MKLKIKNNNPKHLLLNCVYFLFLLVLLHKVIVHLFLTNNINQYDYGISDFLINYQGGFVRRGILGEILYFFVNSLNMDIIWTIKIICFIFFFICCTFFVKSFVNKGYSLYILPLCFFLGACILNGNLIRKDYMHFCFFIPVIWFCENKNIHLILKFFAINFLSIFMILSHEVFAFFALPILFLLLYSKYKNKGFLTSIVTSLLYLLPSIIAFFSTLYFSGNQEIA